MFFKNTAFRRGFLTFCACLATLLLVISFTSIIEANPLYKVPFIKPLEGENIVRFREVYLDEEKMVERKHTGLDIEGKPGESVRAAGNGVVSYIGFSPIGGRTVVIRHNEKIRTTYLNLLNIQVLFGQNILQGQSIATIGADDDPSSDRTHLHFGIIYDGKYIDPENIFEIDYKSISRFVSLKYVESDFKLVIN